jgi:HEAT repeat protein
LGLLNRTEGLVPLLRAVSDRNAEVRMRATESIGALLRGSNLPAEAIVKRLQDQDELVRVAAAETLAEIGDRSAIGSLRNAMADRSPLVRSYVAIAIGTLGDKSDVKLLQRHLNAERSERAQVGLLSALYQLGLPRALNRLIRLLESSDYQVRCAVANSLDSLELRAVDVGVITSSLSRSLKLETTPAARSSIGSAIKSLTAKFKGHSRTSTRRPIHETGTG